MFSKARKITFSVHREVLKIFTESDFQLGIYGWSIVIKIVEYGMISMYSFFFIFQQRFRFSFQFRPRYRPRDECNVKFWASVPHSV